MKTLTVQKLIDILSKVASKDAEVVLEGCDCTGECTAISFGQDAYKGQIILRREDGCFDRDELETITKAPK